jgi:hypothetical protein
MNRPRALAVLLLVPAAVAALAVPAGAAVPSKPTPNFVLRCRDGKHTAKVWLAPYRAVNNCPVHSGEWLVIAGDSGDAAQGNDAFWATSVQPGASFTTTGTVDLSPYLCDPDHYYTDDGMCSPQIFAHLGQGAWCNNAGGAPDIVYRKHTKWHAPTCD